MTTVQTMVKFAALADILKAATVLEKHGLLLNGETASQVIKRFVEANPDINEALRKI